MLRSTHIQLFNMKKKVITDCIGRRMKWKDGARLLSMHPKALSRLKRNYLEHGESVLMGRKPGPKGGTPDNKTPEWMEELVEGIASAELNLGPVPLADKLRDDHGIELHPTTVWRILKRRAVRYTTEYKRWKKEPQLYCLEEPGYELQMDACYPYGRSRKIVSFDAIDDCSRWVLGRAYPGEETAARACEFVDALILRAPFTIKRIRVDNRYGKVLKAYCKTLGIEVITNDPYSPEQNGKIERFHKTLKRNFYWKMCRFDEDIESINYKYSLWLAHYNYDRRHSGFGMNRKTPVQKISFTWLQAFGQLNPLKVTGTLQQYKS